jgi:hypothetical protein
MHPEALIYTLEVSFFGYKIPPKPSDSDVAGELGQSHQDAAAPMTHVPYTQERYREVGVAVGRAMADYFAHL